MRWSPPTVDPQPITGSDTTSVDSTVLDVRYHGPPRSRSTVSVRSGDGGRRRSQASRRPHTQAADGSRRARPQRFTVDGADGGMGWLRVLRRDESTAAARLCAGAVSWRALHAWEHRAGV